jgi:dCMP deaminase
VSLLKNDVGMPETFLAMFTLLKGKVMSRTNGWDKYFYEIAEAVASRSRDNCKVGAVIVRDDGKIILSTGYNGLHREVLDHTDRIAGDKEKLRWACHAETNAIFNAARIGITIEKATIYVTKFPCVWCASAIVQTGIRRIYTLDSGPWKNDPLDDGEGGRSRIILQEAGIKIHTPKFPQPGERKRGGNSRSRKRAA